MYIQFTSCVQGVVEYEKLDMFNFGCVSTEKEHAEIQ